MILPDGPPEVLCDAPNPKAGVWGKRSMILFAPKALGPLYVVPASGGRPTAITQLDEAREEVVHLAPAFLPGGEHFVYFARSRKMTLRDAVYLVAVDKVARACQERGWV